MNKQIKYIHCRNLNKDGSIKPHGGLTIAYGLNDKFKVIGYAAAKCHEKDLYNKHLGRVKSAGRLLSAEFFQEVHEMDESAFIQQSKQGYLDKFC